MGNVWHKVKKFFIEGDLEIFHQDDFWDQLLRRDLYFCIGIASLLVLLPLIALIILVSGGPLGPGEMVVALSQTWSTWLY